LSKFAVPKNSDVMKEIKICPAMVRCGESPRNVITNVRTPVVGFLFFPKIVIMFNFNQPKCKPYACSVKEFHRKPYCPPQRPYTRQLTVSYLFDSNNVNVPFIRLCGKWLKDAGFSVTDKVKVTVKDNLLVLETVK